jgi:hypothetical protein
MTEDGIGLGDGVPAFDVTQSLACAFRGSWALISRDGGQRIRAKVGRVSLTDVGY